MNTISIADYSHAGAECGEAGIALATLELTDIARADSDPGPDASPIPAEPASSAGFFLDDGYGRDPGKYNWLAPDAPRIPRREKSSTYVKFWLLIAGVLGMTGLEVWGGVAFGKWLMRLVG